MDQQLQQALAAIITNASASADAGVNFLQAQLPDAVSQLLLWKLTVSCLSFALSVILFVAAAVLVRKALALAPGSERRQLIYAREYAFDRYLKNTDYEQNEPLRSEYYAARDAAQAFGDDNLFQIISYTVATAFAGGFALVFLDFNWLQIWLAPKIYLIEYAATLVK